MSPLRSRSLYGVFRRPGRKKVFGCSRSFRQEKSGSQNCSVCHLFRRRCHAGKLQENVQWLLPQQLPGTHPCMPGLDPQQPVSPGPAMPPALLSPEARELAERSFCISPLLHWGQETVSVDEKTSTSDMVPHFEHKYSWIGIYGHSMGVHARRVLSCRS